MIKHAMETKNVRDHPSAPGVEAARLYTIVSGKKRTKLGETTDRKRLDIKADVDSGKIAGVALDALGKAMHVAPAAVKPKPPPSKKEISEDAKLMASLKHLDGKITANIREALTQLNALKGIDYAHGEDALKAHRARMQTHQAQLQDVIAKGTAATSAELVKMQTDTEDVISKYNADLARAKRVTQAESKPKAKAKAKGKATAGPGP